MKGFLINYHSRSSLFFNKFTLIYGHRLPLLCHAMVGNKVKYGSHLHSLFSETLVMYENEPDYEKQKPAK